MSSPVWLIVVVGLLLGACQRADSDAGQSSNSRSRLELPGSASAPSTEESCVDQWLAARKLDAYGSPEGTMYAGGSAATNYFGEGWYPVACTSMSACSCIFTAVSMSLS